MNPPAPDDSPSPAVARTRSSRASELIWAVMSGTAQATGADFFPALVRHLAGALGVQHAFIAECTDLRKSRVRTLAFWSGQSLAENVEYDLAGTPCEAVIGGATAIHKDDVQTRFPQDRDGCSSRSACGREWPMRRNR